jgi:transposase
MPPRHALTDEQWERVREVLPAQRTGPTSTLGDRQFIDAVLYRTKTGIPWRDLPERFGPWKSVFNRFSNWAKRGLWASIFEALQQDVDEIGSVVDGSVIRAHQDASGGKGGSDAMLWAALEEVFRASSTSSSIRKRVRSTSRSRRASATK